MLCCTCSLALVDLVVESVKQSGHNWEEGGLQNLDVLHQLQHTPTVVADSRTSIGKRRGLGGGGKKLIVRVKRGVRLKFRSKEVFDLSFDQKSKIYRIQVWK